MSTRNHDVIPTCGKVSGEIRWLTVAVLLSGIGTVLAEDVSEEESHIRAAVWSIRELRNGANTDWPRVYQKAEELVKKYADNPEAQGRIYLEVLKNHALGNGLRRPYEAIAYAQKAAQYPLPPVDKAQLYLSWGDAIQFTAPGAKGEKMQEIRRAATVKYLNGMKVALDNQIPAVPTPPQPPEGVELNVFENGLIFIPDSLSEDMKEKLRQKKAAMEARKAARREYFQKKDEYNRLKEIRDRCDCSRDLILQLYTTVPFDTAELEQLATEILRDPAAVKDLVDRAKRRTAEVLDRVTRRSQFTNEFALEALDESLAPLASSPSAPGPNMANLSDPQWLQARREPPAQAMSSREPQPQASLAAAAKSDPSAHHRHWLLLVAAVPCVALGALYLCRKKHLQRMATCNS
jgi:hypothetical protein